MFGSREGINIWVDFHIKCSPLILGYLGDWRHNLGRFFNIYSFNKSLWMPTMYQPQCLVLRMQRLRPDIIVKQTIVISKSVYSEEGHLIQLSVRRVRDRWDGDAQTRLHRGEHVWTELWKMTRNQPAEGSRVGENRAVSGSAVAWAQSETWNSTDVWACLRHLCDWAWVTRTVSGEVGRGQRKLVFAGEM